MRKLDPESLRCEITATGYTSRQFMEPWDYTEFRDAFRFNTLNTGRPNFFTIEPRNKSLLLADTPDATGYTITGRYWRTPVTLAADADEPAMPEQFHMLIAYWALSKYAGYMSAPEAKQEAAENTARLLNALSVDQLPDLSLGSSF